MEDVLTIPEKFWKETNVVGGVYLGGLNDGWYSEFNPATNKWELVLYNPHIGKWERAAEQKTHIKLRPKLLEELEKEIIQKI